MKIRILDNTLRLRLSQSEVKSLQENGEVRCTILFGPESQLNYSVRSEKRNTIHAIYKEHEISVLLPKQKVQSWADSNEVSIIGDAPIDHQSSLKILVEKDFKCLSERAGEDESDLFPNPEDQHPNC